MRWFLPLLVAGMALSAICMWPASRTPRSTLPAQSQRTALETSNTVARLDRELVQLSLRIAALDARVAHCERTKQMLTAAAPAAPSAVLPNAGTGPEPVPVAPAPDFEAEFADSVQREGLDGETSAKL